MEIAILGEGEVVIRFIDSKGRTLIQEKIGVSGSPAVEARRTIALSVETTVGTVPLSPVLVRQSNAKQHVTFDDEAPSRFTRKRSEAIGCPIDVVNDTERGCAAPPVQGNDSVLLTDDQALARLIQKAARGNVDSSESES